MNVYFNEGAQAVRHVPQDRLGRSTRVSSATFSLVDLRYGEGSDARDLASGSATVGSVDTLLTAAAGPAQADPRRVPVTSVTGVIAGRRYLLFAADGRRESIVVVRVDTSGNIVYALHELQNDYGTTARLQDVEISASFPSGEAADEGSGLRNGAGPYQVTWEYTIGEALYLVPQTIWLSRTSVQPFITETDVLLAYPTLATRLRERATVADAILVATEDYCVALQSAGRDPADFRASDIARVAVRAHALEYAFRWFGTDRDDEAAERCHKQWLSLMDNLTVGQPKTGTVTVDRNTDTAEAGGDQRYASAHFVRS
jgi:hypothetical protein